MPSLLELIEDRVDLSLSRRPGEGTKIVRHKDPRWDVAGLPEDDLRVYQSFQDWKVFECDYIIVFIGEGATGSRLAGVYEVGQRRSGSDVPLPSKYEGWRSRYYYELRKVPGLEDLERNVVVDWGNATRAWHQWLPDHDKVVLQAPGAPQRTADNPVSAPTMPRLVRRPSLAGSRGPQRTLSRGPRNSPVPDSSAHDERGIKGLLVCVGVDGTYGGWNAPVDPDDWSFVYVPIPEYANSQRSGMETSYREFEAALMGWSRMPERLARMSTHLDPDFECHTYGDDVKRGKKIAAMKPGDFVAFYAGLRPVRPTEDNLVYALIGQMFVKEILRAGEVSERRLHENAHTRCVAGTYEPWDVILRAEPERSGRYSRCLPIGSRRVGKPRPESPSRRPGPAYRVLPELLESWGGLSVHDGWIERSATPPSFNRPDRFLKWLRGQNVELLHSNY